MSKEQLYTPEGYQKLVDELSYLSTTRREEIKKDIAEARIKELEELIRNAKVIDEDTVDTTVVSIGSTVKIKKADGDVVAYNIVGSNEADPENFRISDQSPIGKALIGLRAGSKVTVNVPSGSVAFEVVEVSR